MQIAQDSRIYKQAFWLIKLRWVAIVSIIIATIFVNYIIEVQIQKTALFCIAIALMLLNLISYFFLKSIKQQDGSIPDIPVKRTINFQISFDLIALTILLHFSGGVENPFIVYYIFHMIIASILLSTFDSYLQTNFALVLIGAMAFLECYGIIPHYSLKGFVDVQLYNNPVYLTGTAFIFISTSYIVVFMTNYISVQLKKQEEAYRLANIQLQKQDAIKNEYVLRVTHDIKGHLSAIQTNLSVVYDKILGPVGDKYEDFIDRAYNRIIKLTDFVQDLLKLTQMRLDNKFEKKSFSLIDSLSNVINTLKTNAYNKSINLNYRIEQYADKVYGNQFSIEEIISNLILNAIKYTPNGGSIDVEVKTQGKDILFMISDTGVGIPKNELTKVFDEFYRASNVKESIKDGTGLGLSIVKQTVERHGGKIWADSKVNEGTTFYFTIPNV